MVEECVSEFYTLIAETVEDEETMNEILEEIGSGACLRIGLTDEGGQSEASVTVMGVVSGIDTVPTSLATAGAQPCGWGLGHPLHCCRRRVGALLHLWILRP